VRFDALSRSGYSGFSPQAIAAAPRDVWELLALVSADGRERERCVRATPLTPLTARLVAIRAIDWADQVCDAATMRLEACRVPLLVEALPLADQLARERLRGASLERVLDRRLSDDALRATARAPAALVRRAAWRRLIERGAARGAGCCGPPPTCSGPGRQRHELRQRIESWLPMLGTAQQRSLDWVLRTAN
jgi:hypothetical protein